MKREYWFRMVTAYGYVPVAWLLQLISANVQYCAWIVGNSNCARNYMIALTILLLIYLPCELYMFLKIVKPHLEPKLEAIPTVGGGAKETIEAIKKVKKDHDEAKVPAN